MMFRLANKIVQGTGYLAGVATVLILLLVCVEVIARMFNLSTQITDEYAGYLNAAVIFLGLGYSLKNISTRFVSALMAVSISSFCVSLSSQ